jgi:hypothetical protein
LGKFCPKFLGDSKFYIPFRFGSNVWWSLSVSQPKVEPFVEPKHMDALPVSENDWGRPDSVESPSESEILFTFRSAVERRWMNLGATQTVNAAEGRCTPGR